VRDTDIRRAVAALVARRQADREHLLVDEVDVRVASRRIDLLLVNRTLTAFEIKSDFDTLARLPDQAKAYGLVAERALLVVGHRHAEAAVSAVPGWWGVWIASAGPRGGPRLHPDRRPQRNPEPDPEAVAGLLLRDELLAELDHLGGRRGLGAAGVDELRRELVDRAGDALFPLVRRQLLWRPSWRARALSGAGRR